jgi:UDP-glucose 4-epimerase
MQVLVTGGAGYIGSATSAYLLRAGHQVTVYDNLYRGHRAAVPDGADFVLGDIGDAAALGQVLRDKKVEAVLHFAALMEAGESMKFPAEYLQNNVVKSSILLETMLKHGVQKIVFSSTAAVYAGQDTPIQENAPIEPANFYGETKLMIERIIRWYHRLSGLNYAILRYFNACGAMVDAQGRALRGEDHTPESHLIPLTLQAALGQRESIAIFGTDYPTHDGTCVRDYIHIEDLAQAHVLALHALDERPAMTYNLGNGRGYSVREVIQTAKEVVGHDFKVIEAPRREGDSAALVASSEKAMSELGWEPRFADLRTIVQTAWAWHQTHPAGYGDREAK